MTSNSFNSLGDEGRVILSDTMGAGSNFESDISIADLPTIGSCLVDLPPPPAGFINRFQVLAANVDSWRIRLVNKLRSYGSIIADFIATSSFISYACDLNVRANSSSIDRVELLAECVNQLEVRMANNRDDLLLMRSMIDQFHAMSDSQVLLLSNQLQVLREAHQIAVSLHFPMSSGETANPEHTVIVEDPDGKVRGLVQTLVSKDNESLRFRGTVVERPQSSMSTPMGSKATSMEVLTDRPNFTRERHVIREFTERSETLKSRLNDTWFNLGFKYKFPCPLKTHDHEIAERLRVPYSYAKGLLVHNSQGAHLLYVSKT